MRGRGGAMALLVLVGAALGVAIAGVPDRSKDPPLRVAAADATSTTSGPGSAPGVAPAPAAPGAPDAPAAPTTTAAPAPIVPLRPPGELPVLVVNASALPGVAGKVNERFRAQGHPIVLPSTNGVRRDTTNVYFVGDLAQEAKSAASLLGLAPEAAQPLPSPPPAPPRTARLVIVVGADAAPRLAA